MDNDEMPAMHGPDRRPGNGAFHERTDEPAHVAAEPDPLTREQIPDPLVALDFATHVGMRYHAKRRAWFDGLHRLALVVIALGSSAAVAAIFGGLYGAASDLMVAVAVAAALELAVALAARARIADALYRRYNALATEIADAKTIDDDLLRHWDKRRLLIRADSEERLLVLHRICYNLETEARGYGEDALYAVKPMQRLAAHLLSLPPYRPARLDA